MKTECPSSARPGNATKTASLFTTEISCDSLGKSCQGVFLLLLTVPIAFCELQVRIDMPSTTGTARVFTNSKVTFRATITEWDGKADYYKILWVPPGSTASTPAQTDYGRSSVYVHTTQGTDGTEDVEVIVQLLSAPVTGVPVATGTDSFTLDVVKGAEWVSIDFYGEGQAELHDAGTEWVLGSGPHGWDDASQDPGNEWKAIVKVSNTLNGQNNQPDVRHYQNVLGRRTVYFDDCTETSISTLNGPVCDSDELFAGQYPGENTLDQAGQEESKWRWESNDTPNGALSKDTIAPHIKRVFIQDNFKVYVTVVVPGAAEVTVGGSSWSWSVDITKGAGGWQANNLPNPSGIEPGSSLGDVPVTNSPFANTLEFQGATGGKALVFEPLLNEDEAFSLGDR